MRDHASAVLLVALESASFDPLERAFFEREAPAGVTLFRRNFSPRFAESERLLATLQHTRSAGAPPLIVAIDQEGGRVARLKQPFPDLGPAQLLAEGRFDAEALVYLENYGYSVGAALRAFGINVDFAPVLDVLSEPGNVAIGDRVFGTEPEAASLRAGAFLGGLQASGVLGCLKHFPGQGDAKVDTHLGAATVDVPRETLERRELVPFRRLLGQASMVMISHCVYPALSDKPASLSPDIMNGLLRRDLGFTGVIVSDDLNMGALPQDEALWQEALITAVAAGADLLLVCRHLERCRLALEALRREARRSPAFSARLSEAAGRVNDLRGRLFPLG